MSFLALDKNTKPGKEFISHARAYVSTLVYFFLLVSVQM